MNFVSLVIADTLNMKLRDNFFCIEDAKCLGVFATNL